MARSDTWFRQTYNVLIDRFMEMSANDVLPSENALARETDVSRTVVRAVLQRMEDGKIVARHGRRKWLLRTPGEGDRLTMPETAPVLGDLETAFIEWAVRSEGAQGQPLNVARLAREFGVTPAILQEVLAGLGPFGLVQRRSRSGWLLRGFTPEFVVELSEFRSMLELHAVEVILSCQPDHEIWRKIQRLRQDHLDIENNFDALYKNFSTLDEEFHVVINSVVHNRFVEQFMKLFSIIFLCHYSWNQHDLERRATVAIREHLTILVALLRRDQDAALAATRQHQRTSTTTLLAGLDYHQHGG